MAIVKRKKFKPKTKPVRYDGPLKEGLLKTARNRYREKAEDFELTTCLRSLSYFEERAEDIPVQYDGKGKTVILPVYKITVTAELLEKTYQTFWRWTTNSGKANKPIVPAPILKGIVDGKELWLYHREEVRALINIIGKHEERFAYYRADHTETLNKVFSEIEKVRKTIQQEFTKDGNRKTKPKGEINRNGKSGKTRIKALSRERN